MFVRRISFVDGVSKEEGALGLRPRWSLTAPTDFAPFWRAAAELAGPEAVAMIFLSGERMPAVLDGLTGVRAERSEDSDDSFTVAFPLAEENFERLETLVSDAEHKALFTLTMVFWGENDFLHRVLWDRIDIYGDLPDERVEAFREKLGVEHRKRRGGMASHPFVRRVFHRR